MSSRRILLFGDERLEAPNAPVEDFGPELAELVDILFETGWKAPGLGVAAPQIGVNLRLATIDLSVGKDPGQKTVLANPEIADILVLNAKELYVVGKKLGTTNVVVWGKSKRVQRIVAVEPRAASALLNREPGLHQIQGIGDGFVPDILDVSLVDEVIEVTDEEAIETADHVIDIGPGAGVHGGQIVVQGTPAQVMADSASLTGQYLSGKRKIAVPGERTAPDPDRKIEVFGARGNNLQNVHAEIPLGLMTCVTGVSGSGKSTFAYAVEQELFGRGLQVMVLDGDNVRHGLCSDLGFKAEDRHENLRRIGRPAGMTNDQLDACLTDAAMAQALIERDPKGLSREMATSLKRMQTDRIDLLLLHRPDPLMDADEVAEAFDVAAYHMGVAVEI